MSFLSYIWRLEKKLLVTYAKRFCICPSEIIGLVEALIPNPSFLCGLHLKFPKTVPLVQGLQPFTSHESLEQLHHFVLVLGVVHVTYSVFLVSIAMSKVIFFYCYSSLSNFLVKMAL